MLNKDIDQNNRVRISNIERDLGRPLRILHIGNIANNAYINAKIMRSYGIEADVISIDYYHIMGCPEWEEGVIENLEGTQDNPDWGKTRVSNFQRPQWFTQAPYGLVLFYLNSKTKGYKYRTKIARIIIDIYIKHRGATGGWRKIAYGFVHDSYRIIRKIRKTNPLVFINLNLKIWTRTAKLLNYIGQCNITHPKSCIADASIKNEIKKNQIKLII